MSPREREMSDDFDVRERSESPKNRLQSPKLFRVDKTYRSLHIESTDLTDSESEDDVRAPTCESSWSYGSTISKQTNDSGYCGESSENGIYSRLQRPFVSRKLCFEMPLSMPQSNSVNSNKSGQSNDSGYCGGESPGNGRPSARQPLARKFHETALGPYALERIDHTSTKSSIEAIVKEEHKNPTMPPTQDSGFFSIVNSPKTPDWLIESKVGHALSGNRYYSLFRQEDQDANLQTASYDPPLCPRSENNPLSCPDQLSNLGEEFLEKVFEESGTFTSCSPSTTSGSQDSGNTDSSNTTPARSLLSRSGGSQGPASSHKRRRISEEEDEEGNHPNRRSKHQRLNPSDRPEKGQLGRRLACHFHLLNQHIYCKNNVTGKKYETCSGPGWPSMHYLKQHLGNAASSVHKKIRCPRCFKPFKTASAVLKHQDSDTLECRDQLTANQDDIDKATWARIELAISRPGFERMPQSVRDEIDHWVVEALDDFATNELVESRKWDLRKWNVTWRILFPGCELPSSPFYDEDSLKFLTNTELLVNSFKETVESGIELGDIEGIDDDTLDKLLEYLRVSISTASRSNQQPRNLLQQRFLRPSLEAVVSDSPHITNAENMNVSQNTTEQPIDLAEPNRPLLPPASTQQHPLQIQDPSRPPAITNPSQALGWTTNVGDGMQNPLALPNILYQTTSGEISTEAPVWNGQSVSDLGWDWDFNPTWEPLYQPPTYTASNDASHVPPTQFSNAEQTMPVFDLGEQS